FFSSRRRHTRSYGDWSSDVCSSDLERLRLHLQRGVELEVNRIEHGLADRGAGDDGAVAAHEDGGAAAERRGEMASHLLGGDEEKIGRASCRERGESGGVCEGGGEES